MTAICSARIRYFLIRNKGLALFVHSCRNELNLDEYVIAVFSLPLNKERNTVALLDAAFFIYLRITSVIRTSICDTFSFIIILRSFQRQRDNMGSLFFFFCLATMCLHFYPIGCCCLLNNSPLKWKKEPIRSAQRNENIVRARFEFVKK